jgi:hypothetical protein
MIDHVLYTDVKIALKRVVFLISTFTHILLYNLTGIIALRYMAKKKTDNFVCCFDKERMKLSIEFFIDFGTLLIL